MNPHPTTWRNEGWCCNGDYCHVGLKKGETCDGRTIARIESLIKKEIDEKLMKISLEISSIAVQSNNLDLSTGLLEAVRIIDSRLSNNK